MNRSKSAGMILMIATGLAACGSPPPPPPPPAPPPVNLQAEEQKIRDTIQQQLAAIAAKNADGAVAPYAADAQFLAPNADPATGEALKKAWADTLQLPEVALTFAPTSISLDADGTMAVDIGTYNFSFQSPGGKVDDHGKYLEVWRKTGGNWKIVADMYNTSVPLPPPPAAAPDKKAPEKKAPEKAK